MSYICHRMTWRVSSKCLLALSSAAASGASTPLSAVLSSGKCRATALSAAARRAERCSGGGRVAPKRRTARLSTASGPFSSTSSPGKSFRSVASQRSHFQKDFRREQDRPTNPNAFYEKSVKDSYYRLGSTTRISDSWQRFMSATLFVDSC